VLKLAAEELFEYSVRYLALRACSTEELRNRLRPRAANASDVDATIARLQEIGYLDDQRFAESFASNRIESDGFGRMRVLRDLRARRISQSVAENVVERAFEGRSEDESIDSYIERRLPSLAAGEKIEDERKLAAAYRRLRRAGFSSGGILRALKRVAARPESVEEPPPDDGPEDGPGL
jgi:regulatory protein